MRKFLYAVMAFATMTFAVACEEPADDEGKRDDVENQTPDDGDTTHGLWSYKGTVTVESDPLFVDEGVVWQLEDMNGDGIVSLLMLETRFAERMPGLNMEIAGLIDPEYWDNGKLEFAEESIVPLFMGAEMPDYTMTEFVLDADMEEMTASMICANRGTPLRILFEGVRIANPEPEE